MKKLIINALVLVFFLMALSAADDPNEPEPENAFNNDQITYLSEEANEPEPESVFIDNTIAYLTGEANEPEPECWF